MEERAKREEYMKKAISALERKLTFVEKKLMEPSSSAGPSGHTTIVVN